MISVLGMFYAFLSFPMTSLYRLWNSACPPGSTLETIAVIFPNKKEYINVPINITKAFKNLSYVVTLVISPIAT